MALRVGLVLVLAAGLQACARGVQRATYVEDDPVFVEKLDQLTEAYSARDVDTALTFYSQEAFSQSFGLTWKATQGAAEQRAALESFIGDLASATLSPGPKTEVWREGQSRTWTTRPVEASFTYKNGDAYDFTGYHSAIWEPEGGAWKIWYENFWGTVTQTAWAGSPTPPPPPAPEPEPKPEPPPAPAPPPPSPQEILQDIFFDFDKSNIRADQVAVLKANAEFLVANPNIRVLLQGHCDERGSRAYNLRLGQRRAASVRRYLTQNGVSADRIETVSFGKDKPFVTGVDERTWQLNRRVHFVVRSQ